jgi:glucosyl-3-phosphoglycerate synthase
MSDFLQHSRLPTLHHLASPHAGAGEEDPRAWTGGRGVKLVLPALFAECERPALPRILEELAEVEWVDEVVLTMNRMREAEVDAARAFTRRHLRRGRVTLLWNDGPAMAPVWGALEGAGWGGYMDGKGSNIWSALALLRARGWDGLVLSHDTDILNYTRALLWKMVFPLAHPRLDYLFVKGYYSRVTDRLHGRVTRLLVFPLVQALVEVLGSTPFLEFMQSVRYPLAGEFGGAMETVCGFPLPAGWGLEVAMLAEAHFRLPAERVCQVDLGFHYEHKHRPMVAGPAQKESGLVSASREVAATLLTQVLKQAGDRGGERLLTAVTPRYRERAREWLERFEHVSLINALVYDRAAEEEVVAAFASMLEGLAAEWSGAVSGLARAARPSVDAALRDLPELAEALAAAAIEC